MTQGQYYSYCLVGFDSYLDFRTVEFQERVPGAYVCDSCGAVVGKKHLLPCMHVSCLLCRSRESGTNYKFVIGCGRCKNTFLEDKIGSAACVKDGILARVVRCPEASKGCNFTCKLSDLEKHFRQCEYLDTVCTLCNGSVKSKELPKHYAACRTVFTSGARASAESTRLLEDLRNAKKEVEEAMARGSSDEGALREKTASMLEVLERLRIQMTSGDAQNGSTQG